jgi:multidrug efflux pump
VSLSTPFIRRPVATVLLTAAIALAGAVAFTVLPVSPLPQIDFPTITVSAGLPGASPETMASSVATPLERQFGRVAGVTEMTSTSSLGRTAITLQFDLNRNIDAAARDVEAAINAARGYLPTDLPNNPTYRKVNPSDAPILIIALTSDAYDRGRLYDVASTIMQQKLSQVQGVGQVVVGGGSLPAVRVELNPTALNRYGLGLEDIRNLLAAQNANRPKGQVADNTNTTDLATNDQLLKADAYRPLIVSYQNGAALKLSDVANVEDSVEDLRATGMTNGKPSVLVVIFREPGANIIATVDRVREALPQLKASIPAAIDLTVVLDQTTTIRASVQDIEWTLLVSIALVIMVVFIFLRNLRTTFIPAVVVPVSLIGTFGVMYLCGYSLDNLSLMALTISTGFVVDDAIVVIENVTRHLEQGLGPVEAALKGAQEIGFTVLSISISLVAVFIPILLMGGIVGRLFREFAVTLSVAILVSLVVSLTTTPMMCSRILKHHGEQEHGRLYRMSEAVFLWMLRAYEHSLAWVLRHAASTLGILLLTIGLNVYLLIIVPKGFFPQQDTGRINGGVQGAQDTSFQAMRQKMTRFVDIVRADPAVANVMAFTGSGTGTATNTGRVFISLKHFEERNASADQVIDRLRPKLATVPGAALYLQAVQDLRVGGRLGNAQYQYTIQSENLEDLTRWGPILLEQIRKLPELADVNSDQQNNGLQAALVYDRLTASRLGIAPQMIDDTLYDAFGQRQVSTMFTQLNQYHVVMEVEPKFWQSPEALKEIYVRASSGRVVPLSAFTHYEPTTAPLAVNHQGQFPSVTLSFNLTPGIALSDAVSRIHEREQSIGMPTTIHGSFSGTLEAFQASLASQPVLIVTALMAVYIVLGILYESYIHPITILSTLPSAGMGAVLALLLCRIDLSVIALIGIILLIGIVKKNAIMMIDFALEAERGEGKTPQEAIYQASLLRFRPIMMTTMAALLGALPLALGTGAGSELRRPLGIAIVGGLIVSQMLTLYTTPVVYLYLDRCRLWFQRLRSRRPQIVSDPGP